MQTLPHKLNQHEGPLLIADWEVKIKLGIGFSFDLKSLVKLIEEVFNKCKDTQY
tara:strand:- start:1589 stop:1750 length:162 start_codon:yes stop_codon:yes gene_type:complete